VTERNQLKFIVDNTCKFCKRSEHLHFALADFVSGVVAVVVVFFNLPPRNYLIVRFFGGFALEVVKHQHRILHEHVWSSSSSLIISLKSINWLGVPKK